MTFDVFLCRGRYLLSDLVHVLRQDVLHFPHVGGKELLLGPRRLLPLVAGGKESDGNVNAANNVYNAPTRPTLGLPGWHIDCWRGDVF